jgi:hypothetical protein
MPHKNKSGKSVTGVEEEFRLLKQRIQRVEDLLGGNNESEEAYERLGRKSCHSNRLPLLKTSLEIDGNRYPGFPCFYAKALLTPEVRRKLSQYDARLYHAVEGILNDKELGIIGSYETNRKNEALDPIMRLSLPLTTAMKRGIHCGMISCYKVEDGNGFHFSGLVAIQAKDNGCRGIVVIPFSFVVRWDEDVCNPYYCDLCVEDELIACVMERN